jgi:exonuclease III
VHKSRTGNARKLDMRAGLKIATWNVLTLNHPGYVTALVRTLARRNIALAGITEARITGSDSSVVEGYTVLHSDGQQHVNGVALVVSRKLATGLTKWSPISDRLLLARLCHRHGHLTAIVAYAPTEEATDAVKDDFYHQLEALISSTLSHDTLLLLGDLNAMQVVIGRALRL